MRFLLALAQEFLEFLDGSIAWYEAFLNLLNRHGVGISVALKARLKDFQEASQASCLLDRLIQLLVLALERSVVFDDALTDGQAEGYDADCATRHGEWIRHFEVVFVCESSFSEMTVAMTRMMLHLDRKCLWRQVRREMREREVGCVRAGLVTGSGLSCMRVVGQCEAARKAVPAVVGYHKLLMPAYQKRETTPPATSHSRGET